MKVCSTCKKAKSVSEFSKHSYSKDGLKHQCKSCVSIYSKRYTTQLHGLSESVYKALLEKQGGGCRLCGQSPSGRALAIDHDHSCCPGKKSCGECVRGLLCVYCNTRLAALEDEDFLNGALMYLSDTSANPSRTVRLAAEWIVS